LVDIIFDKGE